MPDEIQSLYTLHGRVVTMNDARDILDAGVIYIQGKRIMAVLPASEPAPAPFKDNPLVHRVVTNGTIYPGMIELHNHLSYNILPQWVVPKKFPRRARWAAHKDKTRLITGPMQVLGHSRGFPEAIARYVEAKCLLAGVTTSQGLKLSGVGIEKFYKGIVRNVEQGGNPELPAARTRIPDLEASEIDKFHTNLKKLEDKSALLLHLSEGVDDKSREPFLTLQRDNGEWAITTALAGIHCAGLWEEDFITLQAHGGSMVWSPLSNLMLYQETARIKKASDAGVLIALGSDWSPSGSKNLLGELKIAHIHSQQMGGLFTAQELVEMVTVNPARIVKWHKALGSLQSSYLADLIVLGGTAGDPYDNLIAATEASISLVMIDGVPRCWRQSLAPVFPSGTEQLQVGAELRTLNLFDPSANLALHDLTIAAARERLQHGLHRLPELALELENASAMGAALGFDPIANEAFPILVLDEDELLTEPMRPLFSGNADEELHELAQILAGIKYSDLLQGVVVELDPLTMVDDPGFFQLFASQRNLNQDLKLALAAFYGIPLPPPISGKVTQPAASAARARVRTLKELITLSANGYLSLTDRQRIVEQALVLLERVYVHLPFKRAMHAIDPVQRLKLLQYRLEQVQMGSAAQPGLQLPPEIEFHKEMISIFTSLRDLHTNYLLPKPYRGMVAYLPFVIEAYTETNDAGKTHRFIASKILTPYQTKYFTQGVEVLYWNGIPIQQAIALNGEHQAGGNPDARLARGLEALTIRPLARSLPPDEEWVVLTYKDNNGDVRTLKQEWLVFDPDLSGGIDAESGVLPATALGLDVQADIINKSKKSFYASPGVNKVASQAQSAPKIVQAIFNGTEITTGLPNFKAFAGQHNGLGFGYIRIYTFNVADDVAFVDLFLDIVKQLPETGLIIDVRNNGGGLIWAAERLLQALVARPIEPQPAQFINTSLTLEICRRNNPSQVVSSLDLNRWIPSIEQSIQTGAAYSLGYPITPLSRLQGIQAGYPGKVVLITDALCYSATDMFAAGFKDHGIGKILGTSGNTGAGGANVWTHTLLDRLLRQPGPPYTPYPTSPFKPLPFGAEMRVAIRRTLRVGAQAGVPVEDLGITPDEIHDLTRDDLLYDNVDLIKHACMMLV